MKDWTLDKIKDFNGEIDKFVPKIDPHFNGLYQISRGDYLFRIDGLVEVSIYRGDIKSNGTISVYIRWISNHKGNYDSNITIGEEDWPVISNHLVNLIKDVYFAAVPIKKLDHKKYKITNIRDMKLISLLDE